MCRSRDWIGRPVGGAGSSGDGQDNLDTIHRLRSLRVLGSAGHNDLGPADQSLLRMRGLGGPTRPAGGRRGRCPAGRAPDRTAWILHQRRRQPPGVTRRVLIGRGSTTHARRPWAETEIARSTDRHNARNARIDVTKEQRIKGLWWCSDGRCLTATCSLRSGTCPIRPPSSPISPSGRMWRPSPPSAVSMPMRSGRVSRMGRGCGRLSLPRRDLSHGRPGSPRRGNRPTLAAEPAPGDLLDGDAHPDRRLAGSP